MPDAIPEVLLCGIGCIQAQLQNGVPFVALQESHGVLGRGFLAIFQVIRFGFLTDPEGGTDILRAT